MTIHQTQQSAGSWQSLATSFEFIYVNGGERECGERASEGKSKRGVSCGRTVSKRTARNVRLRRGLHKSARSDARIDRYGVQSHVDFDFVCVYMKERCRRRMSGRGVYL